MFFMGKSQNISCFSEGTNNNFNLIRLLCAWGVLIYHCAPLAEKTVVFDDPFWAFFGASMGEILVTVFFSVSGFLIYRSICRSSGVLSYIVARTLRLLPALIVVMIISVFILGPLISTLSLESYFSNPNTWSYLSYNLNLLDMRTQYALPGSFESNPYPSTVNGSLWTLPIETRMYVVTIVIFYASTLCFSIQPSSNHSIIRFIFLSAFVLLGFLVTEHYQVIGDRHKLSIAVFACAFLIGSVCYSFKENIPLKFSWGVILLFGTQWLNESTIYPLYLAFCITYITLVLAYLPRGRVLAFNKVGDYSYGMYIFAFPVQQSLSHWTDIGFWGMVFWATVITLFLSIISWHIIEKPALSKKSVIMQKLSFTFIKEKWILK